MLSYIKFLCKQVVRSFQERDVCYSSREERNIKSYINLFSFIIYFETFLGVPKEVAWSFSQNGRPYIDSVNSLALSESHVTSRSL